MGYIKANCKMNCLTLSDKKVRLLINNKHTDVLTIDKLKNNFGEFNSILIKNNSIYFRLCGYGFHNLRDRFLIDSWRICKPKKINIKEGKQPLFKSMVNNILDNERKTQILLRSIHIQSDDGRLYEDYCVNNSEEEAYQKYMNFKKMMSYNSS